MGQNDLLYDHYFQMPFYPTCALQTEGTLTTNTSFPSNMRPTDPSTSFQRRGHRPNTIWVVWQEFWEQYSGANLLLPRDLGAWVAPTHRQWNWFYNYTTNTMSKWTETQSGVTNARPLAEWPPVQQTPTTAVDAISSRLWDPRTSMLRHKGVEHAAGVPRCHWPASCCSNASAFRQLPRPFV